MNLKLRNALHHEIMSQNGESHVDTSQAYGSKRATRPALPAYPLFDDGKRKASDEKSVK